MRKEKVAVRNFYDSFGWRKESTGRHKDTVAFEDVRPVSMWYRSKAHLRIAQFFGRGKYFLDAGSGPISEPEYIVYSSGYKLRVCVDISETALKEARSKIPDKGLYVVADVTQLPFRDGVFDAAISAHVLYHVPSDEQGTVLMELYRTLRDPGVCIVVYGQFTGLSAHLEPLTRLVGRILALGRRIVGAQKHKREHRVGDSGPAKLDETPPLYAHAHDGYQTIVIRKNNPDAKLSGIAVRT